MRVTIVGKARDLSISCENADKRLMGDIYVEGHDFIGEAFEERDLAKQNPSRVGGFISIFARGSEALRRLLVVRNLDTCYQQVIDRYAALKNLTTVERDGARLFIAVMLDAADFGYFAGFIETNFFTELQWIMDVPFHRLSDGPKAQADVAAKYGYILPTKREFESGKPCFFPNAGISFGFEHPRLSSSA